MDIEDLPSPVKEYASIVEAFLRGIELMYGRDETEGVVLLAEANLQELLDHVQETYSVDLLSLFATKH